GAVTLLQRSQDRDRAPQAAAHVGDLESGQLRRAVGRTLESEQPGASHVVHVVSGAIPERSGLAVAGERANDELRVLGHQDVVSDSQAIEHPWTELLEHDVVARRELLQHGGSARLFEIEDQTAFAAAEGVKEAAVPVDLGTRYARVVARLRVFYLVHRRTEICQDQRR